METQFLNCSMINIINKYMEENYKLKSEIDKLIKENKKSEQATTPAENIRTETEINE